MDKYFRKYVWDDERTPYLIPVSRLTRTQAGYELHIYAVFLGVLFVPVTLATLSTRLLHGNTPIVSLYAFTVVCAAMVLGVSRHVAAAYYCATPPLAVLAYFAAFGFHSNLGHLDKALLIAFMVGWLVYCRRLVSVARAYESLPEPPPPPRD